MPCVAAATLMGRRSGATAGAAAVELVGVGWRLAGRRHGHDHRFRAEGLILASRRVEEAKLGARQRQTAGLRRHQHLFDATHAAPLTILELAVGRGLAVEARQALSLGRNGSATWSMLPAPEMATRCVMASPTLASTLSASDSRVNWPTAPWKLAGAPAGNGWTSSVSGWLATSTPGVPRKSPGRVSRAGSMTTWPATVGKSTCCSSVTR